MLSLDNSYNIDELRAFDERCQTFADGRPLEYVAELKIDGLSISLHYDEQRAGAWRYAWRRSHWRRSNSECAHDSQCPLATEVRSKADDGEIEVRGEVFIPRKCFEKTNAEREEQGEPRFANPRNAAAGAIRQLDSKLVAQT